MERSSGGRLSNGGARDEGEGARSLRPRRSARASRLATEDSDWDSEMDDEELDEEEGVGGRGGVRGGGGGGREKKKVGRPIAYKGDPDAPGLTEEDRRRIKRRIANRESARRVRQKRQEQLDELEVKVGELARQNQALAAHLAEVEAHKGQLAAQVAALRERWQGAAAENLRLTSELAALRKVLQAQMGDVPLPASEAIVNAGSDAGSLAALAAVPERQPSAPSPAEFFGNIAALTSGSYGGLPVPGSLAEGPDLAGPLSLDAPGVPSVGPGPMGGIRDQTGGSGYGMPEPLHMPKADAWRAFGRPGATGGAPPGGGGAQVGPRPGGHQEPGTPEYSEPANGGAARGPFGAVAGNALGGQPIDSWRAGGQQGWRSLSGTGMGGSGSGGTSHQQLLEDWRSISGPATARGGGELRRGRGTAPLMPAPAEEPPPPLPRMARTASPAVNTQRGWSGDLQSLLRAASISAAADGLSDIFDDVDEVVGGAKKDMDRMERQPSVPSRRKPQGPKAAI